MTGYARYDLLKNNIDIKEFRGLNVTPMRSSSEMRNMLNLSSANYPYLSPRKPREAIELPEGISHIEKIFRANGKLCFIADGKMWYDGKVVGYVGKDSEKSIAVCNGKICVVPDMVCYDYRDNLFGRMDGKISIVKNGRTMLGLSGDSMYMLRYAASIRMEDFPWADYLTVGDSIRFFDFLTFSCMYNECRVRSISDDGHVYLDGIDFGNYGDKELWPNCAIVINNRDVLIVEMNVVTLDSDLNTLTFSIDDNEEYGNHYTRYTGMRNFAKAFLRFDEGDGIRFGDDTTEYQIEKIVIGARTVSMQFADASSGTPDYGDVITLCRVIPEMNYICEKDNRLYGVCNSDNTVVTSKLGQPLTFRCFSGTSLDSYSVEVGSDGEFTGIATYAGDVVLFKERYIHLLSGSKPSLYRLSGIETYGCRNGCADSICAVSGRIFYNSLRGIYVFDGSFPNCISKELGDTGFSRAFATDDDRRYYVAMTDSGGVQRIYVYDTDTGFWHVEDGAEAVSMVELGGNIYIAKNSEVQRCGYGNGKVEWSAEFGEFDLYSVQKKTVSSVTLRYELMQGSTLRVEVSYDGGTFDVVRELFYEYDRVMCCDLPLRRCDQFRLRLSGKGDVKIRGLHFKVREGEARS